MAHLLILLTVSFRGQKFLIFFKSVSFFYDLKSGTVSLPTLFFFFKIMFSLLGPLDFYMNVTISLSTSTTKAAGILIWFVISL